MGARALKVASPAESDRLKPDREQCHHDHSLRREGGHHRQDGTGSGKFSLIKTLFNLLSRSHGAIHVDGVSLNNIPCSLIRERLVGLPQFSVSNGLATLRRNLDPSGTRSDAEISVLLDIAEVQRVDFDLDQIWETCGFPQGWQQRQGS